MKESPTKFSRLSMWGRDIARTVFEETRRCNDRESAINWAMSWAHSEEQAVLTNRLQPSEALDIVRSELIELINGNWPQYVEYRILLSLGFFHRSIELGIKNKMDDDVVLSFIVFLETIQHCSDIELVSEIASHYSLVTVPRGIRESSVRCIGLCACCRLSHLISSAVLKTISFVHEDEDLDVSDAIACHAAIFEISSYDELATKMQSILSTMEDGNSNYKKALRVLMKYRHER
jgi:hypothetical protein